MKIKTGQKGRQYTPGSNSEYLHYSTNVNPAVDLDTSQGSLPGQGISRLLFILFQHLL